MPAWTNPKLSTVNLKLITIINSNKTTFSQYLRNEPKDAPRGEIRNLKERHKNWDKVKNTQDSFVILGIDTVWRFLFSLVCYGCQINPPLLSICIAQCFLHDVNYGTYCQPIQCCPIPQQIFAHISLSICYLSTDNLCIPRWGGRVRRHSVGLCKC